MAPPNKLKLPKQLADQLGIDSGLSSNHTSRGRASTRKDLRKAARAKKKAARTEPPPAKKKKLDHSPESLRQKDTSKPRQILRAPKKTDPIPAKHDTRSVSPPVKKPKPVRNKFAEEDEEIAALEKKLGLKGKKKHLGDGGFDDLLEGLEEEEDSDTQDIKKRKAEGDEWLDQKRAEACQKKGLLARVDEEEGRSSEKEYSNSEDDDGASDMSLHTPEFPDDESNDNSNELGNNVMLLDADHDFDGFDLEDNDEEEQSKLPLVRENPYVAPVTNGEAPQKYIPPSLRKPVSSDSEALVRLRRQTQGLVNRLTESNLISITGDIEQLYRAYPRQHVTSTLVDILLTSVCEPTSLPDTLIILPAGFIAAVYKLIGMDFGAQVVQKTVDLFDEHYSRAATDLAGPAAAASSGSKETSNLIMLLSEMYNFQVIGSNLLFDYIKLFLEKLSELHAELLLKIIRTSGPQLRRDDPSSLKDIVAMLRPAVASVGGEDKISVRTKFMIETINDLKNNRMKTGGAASAVTSEHTVRMKKTLGTLNTRSIKASEPLRVGLNDIKDSDKKGKWWLVGASWTGNIAGDNRSGNRSDGWSHNSPAQVDHSPGTSDLSHIAREQGMNTDIRIAIFVAIMDATDYKDAHLRLMNLKLKKVQEYEVPTVLIHCAGSEKAYNPYYALVAKRICGDKKLKTSFQFCLWDIFKKMGETDDDSEVIEDENMDTRRIVNLAKLFGKLMGGCSVGLSVLKKLNLSYLQAKTKIFMEVLFITIFLESQRESETKRDEQSVNDILDNVKNTPQLITGLLYFLKKVVSKTDIAGGKKENATVKWACKIARDTLESFVASD